MAFVVGSSKSTVVGRCSTHARTKHDRKAAPLHMVALTLNPSKTALILIEYQNEFTTPGGKLHEAVKDVMEKTNSEFRFL